MYAIVWYLLFEVGRTHTGASPRCGRRFGLEWIAIPVVGLGAVSAVASIIGAR